MNLQTKPDWDDVKQRYLAWWHGAVIDRCCIAIYAPQDGLPPAEPPAPPPGTEARWLDTDYLRAMNDFWLSRNFYGGEALPIWHPGYPGWNSIPAFLGCPVIFAEQTAWWEPIIGEGALDAHDYRALTITPDSPWRQRSLALQRLATAEARGRALPTTGAFGGCGDTLAALRGTERLLVDLVDCPELVREWELYLMRQWCEVFDGFYAVSHDAAEGSTGWFDLWSPGKFYATQNDFAYMISPRMFRDIFLPALELQTQFLDHAIHHVDGVGNFAHVDALCELPRLGALQILPGAGKPSPLHYLDVLKQVQAHGKNLHISIGPHEVETALRELRVEGLFIQTWCASEAEARALLKNVARWSHA